MGEGEGVGVGVREGAGVVGRIGADGFTDDGGTDGVGVGVGIGVGVGVG